MYAFTTTPDPPTRLACPVRQEDFVLLPHEPADIPPGSALTKLFPTVRADDGGVVAMLPCKHCGAVYWDVMQPAEKPVQNPPRDLSRREYLDLAAKGQVTDGETLIYLEHCYAVDDLSRDSRMRLSAQIEELRDKLT